VVVLRLVIGVISIFFLAGCEKQSGEAIVLAKEHIAAAPSETATAQHMASPDEEASPNRR
jgi:hypothetical protein